MICEACGEHSFLIPLHGDRGAPMRCPLCVGKWNAEHMPRLRARRGVIRALKAYDAAGGTLYSTEFDKKRLLASGTFTGSANAADFSDLTSELLTATIALTHPDKHPPERKWEANRVTQELLALKPFVFPAPEPPPPPPPKPEPDNGNRGKLLDPSAFDPLNYPCEDCSDTFPANYCDACKAEWERRQREEYAKESAKRQADYARRRARVLAGRGSPCCAVCGAKFKADRSDAKFCSAKCRQQAHRQACHSKKVSHGERSFNCDNWGQAILALLARHRAIWLNDLLPKDRTRAQYQALCVIAAKLEADGKLEKFSYAYRSGKKPGFAVLVKPGHYPEDPDHIHRLKDHQRLSPQGDILSRNNTTDATHSARRCA